MCLFRDAPSLLQVDGFSNAEMDLSHRRLSSNRNNYAPAQKSVDERTLMWWCFA